MSVCARGCGGEGWRESEAHTLGMFCELCVFVCFSRSECVYVLVLDGTVLAWHSVSGHAGCRIYVSVTSFSVNNGDVSSSSALEFLMTFFATSD